MNVKDPELNLAANIYYVWGHSCSYCVIIHCIWNTHKRLSDFTNPTEKYTQASDGNFYHVNATGMSWEDAKATCNQEGTRLAIIINRNMYRAISKMTLGKNVWLAAFKAEGNERIWRWIDENDKTTEFGNFTRWMTERGEPNDASHEKRCLAQGTHGEPNWYAMGCSEPYNAICQLQQKGNWIYSFLIVN